MCSNGWRKCIMGRSRKFDLKSESFLAEESSSDLPSSWQREKKNPCESSKGLGEVYPFPDITKCDTGRCCNNLLFGGESKWEALHLGNKCTVACWKPKHFGLTKEKVRRSFNKGEDSWDTLKASQYCPEDSHNTAARMKTREWAELKCPGKNAALFSGTSHLKWAFKKSNLIS